MLRNVLTSGIGRVVLSACVVLRTGEWRLADIV